MTRYIIADLFNHNIDFKFIIYLGGKSAPGIIKVQNIPVCFQHPIGLFIYGCVIVNNCMFTLDIELEQKPIERNNDELTPLVFT